MSLAFDIPLRKNGDLNIDASWFNLIRTALLGAAGFKKFTITHTQLQAAALTNDIELFSLLAKEEITAVYIKHSIAGAGAGITSYTLSLGLTGELDRYAPAFDIFQVIGNTVFQRSGFNLGVENFGAANSVRVAAVADANLDNSTAGSFDIWVQTSTLG